jgi:hypothetical protein
LVERMLADFLRVDVVERFAAVFLPPREAAAFDGARFAAAAFLPPREAAAFDGARFEAAAFLPPREAAAFAGARLIALAFFLAPALVFLRAAVVDFFFAPADVFFFAPDDVLLRALALDVFLAALDVFFFAPADVFLAAVETFLRELGVDLRAELDAPVLEREAARAALVELDPADASASLVSAQGWLTIGAAIFSARSGERSCSSSLSMLCSYCGSRLSLHASGISSP